MVRRPATVELTLGLDEAFEAEALRAAAARAVGVEEVRHARVARRSLDARGGRVRFRITMRLDPPSDRPLGAPYPREVSGERHVAIVGAGPAGLFCAYELARAGARCTVLDRGRRVQPRRRDLAALHRDGRVDPDSNYCFGEGGAGTFSDGKLYTRAHKRGSVRDVLETLVAHGAPRDILVEARPHVGSNRLPRVVTALRERLESAGVGFRFEAKVTGLVVSGAGGDRRVGGVLLRDGTEIGADAVVIATGHSARDIHEVIGGCGVRLEAKPFAVGVRVEHPQPLVDRIQYGADAGHPRLPAAAYRLATRVDGRGVYSFCMCPGGFVVPAATAAGEVVTNGMSLAKRASPFANAGIVVAVEPRDLERAGLRGPLAGVALQRRLEVLASEAGGGGLRAPATRLTDLLAGRASSTLPPSSYRPGLCAGDVSAVLDGTSLPLAGRLRRGLARFGRRMRGFVTEDCAVVAVESRTSSPVRIPRDPGTLEAPDLAGLYPCGEGAGYAGGIVSSALDGIRVARALLARRGTGASRSGKG